MRPTAPTFPSILSPSHAAMAEEIVRLRTLVAAMRRISVWADGDDYAGMDEPRAARIAREALAVVGEKRPAVSAVAVVRDWPEEVGR